MISIIPDEREAIDAALQMGETGDLVLIFADALVRSWKQITKFKQNGTTTVQSTPQSASLPASQQSASQFAASSPRAPFPSHGGGNGAASPAAAPTQSAYTAAHRDLGAATASAAAPEFNLEGLIRDERGIHMAKESDD
jgi:hypothetical protein